MTTTTTPITTSGTWNAPATMLFGQVTLTAFGAIGYGQHGAPGGFGSKVTGTVEIAPTQSLIITIGANGTSGAGGTGHHNGGAGGAAGGSSSFSSDPGGGGGGSTSVFFSTTLVCEAAGGGGAGGTGQVGGDNNTGGGGGSGDGGNGGGGANVSFGGNPGSGGQAASSGTDGAGGAGSGLGAAGGSGSAGAGGGGGAGEGPDVPTGGGGGGGGGGGASGGGAGGGAGANSGGGGGGGGFSVMGSSPLFTSGVITPGVSTLFGSVNITYTFVDAPTAPTLTNPTPGEFVDTFTLGATFSGLYNTGTDTGNLENVSLSLQTDGGTVHYWNGTDFTSLTPQWVVPTTGFNATSGQPFSVVVPAGILADGHSYTYSFATQEAVYGLQSPYAAGVTFSGVVGPTATITSPLGTINTLTPTVSWTETLPVATQLIDYRYVLYTSAQESPGGGSPIYDSGTVTAGGPWSSPPSFVLPGTVGLISPDTYYGYLLIHSTGGVPSAWEEATFTVNLVELATPTLTAIPVTDPTTSSPCALLGMTAYDNLMSGPNTGFEAPLNPALGGVTGCSAVESTTFAAEGLQSLKITSLATSWLLDLETVPVLAGTTYQFRSRWRAATTGRTVQGLLKWRNAGGGVISTSTIAGTDVSGSFTETAGTAVAPVGAVNCDVVMSVPTTVNGEVRYLDKVGLWGQATATWTLGCKNADYDTEFQISADGGTTWGDVVQGSVDPTLGPVNSVSSLYDLGAPFNIPLLYRVRNFTLVGVQTYFSAWSDPVEVASVPSINWWVVPPTQPDLAMLLHRLPSSAQGTSPEGAATPSTPATPSGLTASITIDEWEQQGVFRPFGKATATVIHGDLWTDEFDLSLYFLSTDEWENFKAIRELQSTVMLKSDMEGSTYWVTFGPDLNPGIIARSGRQTNPTRGLTIHCTPVDPWVPVE